MAFVVAFMLLCLTLGEVAALAHFGDPNFARAITFQIAPWQ